MDVFEAIEGRRSIRKYQGRSIPDDQLRKILEAGRLAPSAANRQPWHAIVVQDPEMRRSCAIACNKCDYVADCAALVVCAGDPSDSYYCVDAGIVLENMALAAWALGIGSCYIGYFDEAILKSLLHIPPDLKIVACLALGYPAETPTARPRKSFEDLFSWDKYNVRPGSPPL